MSTQDVTAQRPGRVCGQTAWMPVQAPDAMVGSFEKLECQELDATSRDPCDWRSSGLASSADARGKVLRNATYYISQANLHILVALITTRLSHLLTLTDSTVDRASAMRDRRYSKSATRRHQGNMSSKNMPPRSVCRFSGSLAESAVCTGCVHMAGLRARQTWTFRPMQCVPE